MSQKDCFGSFMTEFIGKLTSTSTTGEKRVYRILETLFEDDPHTFCYYEPLIVDHRPDFVLFNPQYGCLIIEVKDYSHNSLLDTPSNGEWTALVSHQLELRENPFTKIYNYWKTLKHRVKDTKGEHPIDILQRLIILPFVSKNNPIGIQILSNKPQRIKLFFKEDILSYNTFKKRLERQCSLDYTLSSKEMTNLRGNIIPTSHVPTKTQKLYEFFPLDSKDVLQLLDAQQEQLSHNLGTGHRLIFGVAGSGKTVLLLARARYLALLHKNWKILILCYNRLLANYLQEIMNPQDYDADIEISNYHRWAKDIIFSSDDKYRYSYNQLLDKHSESSKTKNHFFSKIVPSILNKLIDETTLTDKYDAILIDEAQDFEKEWFIPVVKLLNPDTKSLLITCDGLQGIYARKRFTWKSVGIEAQGRVTKFRKTYRNPSKVGKFAYKFLTMDLDLVNLIDKEEGFLSTASFERKGGIVDLRVFGSRKTEHKTIIEELQKNIDQKRSILLLFPRNLEKKNFQHPLISLMKQNDMIWHSLNDVGIKKGEISIGTLQATKGLEADVVVIPEIDKIRSIGNNRQLLYVGMTRTLNDLLITSSGTNNFVKELKNLAS
jgi:superfamily I DNA/RNA helicase